MFRASGKKELHNGEKEGRIPTQLRMAEARVEVVDNDVGLAAFSGAGGEFAAREDLKKLRDLVSASHQLQNSVRIFREQVGKYLSPMFAVSLLFRASNMLSLFLSSIGDHA